MQYGVRAYSKVNATAQVAPRELEATLLIKGAAKLEGVKRDWERKEGLPEALAYNRKLWTILASSATAAENPLPVQVKNDFGNLAVFVLRSLIQLAAEPRLDQMNRLIEINATVAAGLRN